jgi:hypothetical protein
MGVRMSSRSLLLVLGALAFMSAAAPRAAHAQTTGLFFDSQPGDYIGGGHLWSYSAADATFTTDTASSFGTVISLDASGSPHVHWTLMFQAAGVQPPAVGVYESARSSGSFTSFAGLMIFGDGRGCGPVGRFVVLEAVYASNGSVVRFAADFEQHCGVSDAALFGAVRYNSTVSTMVPFDGAYPIRQLTVTPPAHGSVQGDGINCGSSGSQCLLTLPAPATAALTAVPDPGFVFAGWTGDCSAGPRITVRINMPKRCSAAFTPFIPLSPRTLAVITGTTNAVTRGIPVVVSPANSVWTLSPWGNGFKVQFDFIGPDSSSYAWFTITPPTGETFEVGREYQGNSSPDATHGSFWATSDSTTCDGGATFTVRDWAPGSGGLPARFSIDFRQACASGLLYGTLQYASTFEYGRIDVVNTALHFTAVRDQVGIVSHSADQLFSVSPSAPSAIQWEVKSDQAWLTAAPPSGTSAPIAARIRTGATVPQASPVIGHLQVFARGIVNVPDPVTVTLDLVSTDTTVRPFGVFRPESGTWFMPGQAAQQFGLPGDIPLSGDFDGDGAPDIAIFRPWTGEWFAQGQATRQWGSPGDIPVPADYNGDGITDLAVFRQSGPTALWFIVGDSAPRAWGLRGDIPVPGDYDGDGLPDLAVFRPATGTWWILRSSTGQTVSAAFGLPGDIPLVADFDADRRIDLAVFRPSAGFWYITLSAGGTDSRQLGLPGDIPVPLDVSGDGRAELRVWRPSTGTWHSYDRWTSQFATQQYGLPGDVPVMARPVMVGSRPVDLDGDRRADVTIYRPSAGQWFTRQSTTGYSTFTSQQLGVDGDIPVPGDYDGDRFANPAVYHPSTGGWSVRRVNGTVLQRTWGAAGDLPVPADYDGDGRTDMAVYRPSSGGWFILTSASGFSAGTGLSWGAPGDVPVPGDFDGDGRADVAVYRPSTGEWLVAPSSGGGLVRQWGLSGDLPIARDFDGDGRADLAIYRPATGEWYVLGAISGTHIFTRQWGLNGDVPVADDYDGDGIADVAVYRPVSGEWFVVPSSGAPSFVLQWGLTGDVPVTRR